MKSLGLSRYALAIGAASALLAGCGGSQPPIGAPGAMPQSRATTTQARHGKSWMLPEAKRENLIYTVSNPRAVLSYDTGKLVGTIVSSYDYEGVCADESGNVFYGALTAACLSMLTERLSQ